MRGILFVVLGAALIWLGLGRGGGSEVDDTVAAAERTGALDGAPAVTAPERPAPRAAADPQVAEGLEPERGDAAQGAAASAPEPVPRGPLQVDLGLGAAPQPARAASDEVVLSTAREVPAERVGRLLVECWVGERPGELQAFLESGEGATLPAARRQLIASFWRACMGVTDRAAEDLALLQGEAGVTSEQLELLRVALRAPGARALPASSSGARDPLARGMRMVLAAEEARAALERGDFARAAESTSDLVLFELGAPWPPQREALLAWGQSLRSAQERHRLSPAGRWPAIEYTVRPNDHLIGIRKRLIAANDKLVICTGLIEATNGIRDGHIVPGDVLRVPTDVPNVLVDLDARVTVFRLGAEVVRLWEVGIGREGHDTPVGTFTAGPKLKEPPHMPEGGPQLPYGHPDNPLGTRWIPWERGGKNTSIGFHGTSDPSGVGDRVSLGCIRMRNEDVEELFELLPEGARIVVQP